MGKPRPEFLNPIHFRAEFLARAPVAIMRINRAEGSLSPTSPVRGYTPENNQPFNVTPKAIALLAIAVHAPLLLMQLPAFASGAQTQMFLAKHYASSWFNPWNTHWFGGFSQTTSAPLTQ